MTIAIVTGTRPEIIKMYPIIKILDTNSIDYSYIHTGQHYDYELFLKFIEEFGIRRPDYTISFEESTVTGQVARIIKEVGLILDKILPALVLAEGDTNSVLASALAALKNRIPIAHIEAGLRSNDWRTVEEHNRRIVDHVSDILFSPSAMSSKNLRNEHVYGEIHTVGNTIIDAINLRLGKEYLDNDDHSKRNKLFSSLKIDPSIADNYILVTMHRSENVDDPRTLKQVLTALSDTKLNYLFPMHPHTLKRIHQYRLTKYLTNRIRIIDPVGYMAFLQLLKNCQFVITDSGGVQEEVTSPRINKRALILRDCTERPESVKSGHCVLCKIDRNEIVEQIQRFDKQSSRNISYNKCPYGDGTSAMKIVEIISNKFALKKIKNKVSS
jgi:UDP-N-acetylglucosamine 2-epimerase (non-hydrolysing)